MKENVILFLKGIAIGTANIIPGVSGGTIALLTNVFEPLVQSLKSFDLELIKLLFRGKWSLFAQKINLSFLIVLFAGLATAVISLAHILAYLFQNYPLFIWSFFFGLILASIYFVAKTVDKWTLSSRSTLLLGTIIAVILSVLNPATENSSFLYLLLCGIVAIVSMILPGISGSYILILMGNYELIAIEAVNEFNLGILIPVALGSLVGLLSFTKILAHLLKKFHNETISLLTGFIIGSLYILWPWKTEIFLRDESGSILLRKGKKIVLSYERYLPTDLNSDFFLALFFIALGAILIVIIEKYSNIQE